MKELGPGYWYLIHQVSKMNISDSEYIHFVENFSYLLPCKQCGKHFRNLIAKYTLETFGRTNWSFRLHDMINIKLNKVYSATRYPECINKRNIKGVNDGLKRILKHVVSVQSRNKFLNICHFSQQRL